MATQLKKNVVILGSNDTAYQLQQGILSKGIATSIAVVNDSDYIYCSSTEYPKLLSGNLSIKEAGLLNNQFHSNQVKYLRTPPPKDNDRIFINTIQDAHYVSVLHLPYGRRRYFTLRNTDNVIMAGAELAQYKSLVVYGSTQTAISYATDAANTGFKVYIVTLDKTRPNNIFDLQTSLPIAELFNSVNIALISPVQAESPTCCTTCLFARYSHISLGLMR